MHLKHNKNFLVCMEMFFMCLAGAKAFSFHEFKHGQVCRGKFCDVIKDLQMTFLTDLRLIKPRKLGFTSENEMVEGFFILFLHTARTYAVLYRIQPGA